MKRLRIQIICDTSIDHFRRIVLGARHYAYTKRHIQLDDRWLLQNQSGLREFVKEEGIQGIIAQARDRRAEQRLLDLGIPAVSLTNSIPKPRLSMVVQDNVALGYAAAEHLFGTHCLHFAAWGQIQAPYSRDSISGFRMWLRARGRDCAVAESPSVLRESGPSLIRRMQAWLKTLPRPLGVFAVLDTYGSHLIEAARRLGYQVPGDVAVLGVGDDEFWTDFEEAPLSSVKIPSRQIGYESMRLLDELCHKRVKVPVKRVIKGAVFEIAARKSTDITFVNDPAVAKASGFIRTHATNDIYVADVVRAAGVSRPLLQKRFKEQTGRTVLAEIQRERIECVKRLLRTTEMKLPEIAEACHFSSLPRMHRLFRKLVEKTPGQYRALCRAR